MIIIQTSNKAYVRFSLVTSYLQRSCHLVCPVDAPVSSLNEPQEDEISNPFQVLCHFILLLLLLLLPLPLLSLFWKKRKEIKSS